MWGEWRVAFSSSSTEKQILFRLVIMAVKVLTFILWKGLFTDLSVFFNCTLKNHIAGQTPDEANPEHMVSLHVGRGRAEMSILDLQPASTPSPAS